MQHIKIRKGNLKLYALIKIQKGKHENYPSPMLGQNTIIRSKKVKPGNGEQKGTNSPG